MEAFFTFLVFVAVMVIAAVVFAGWLVVSILRLALRGLMPVVRPSRPSDPTTVGWLCTNAVCQASNPQPARFCRRCGRPMTGGAMRVVRAA